MEYEKTVRQWQSYNISKESDIDKYLHSFRILFAYNSGKIENAVIDHHDDCYEILKPKIISKEKISVDLIKQMHFELCKGTYDERRYLENGEKPGGI